MFAPIRRSARSVRSGRAGSHPAGEPPRPEPGPQESAFLTGRVRAPHRARRAVGVLLIVAGLTVAGSAWWEEWGTGIQTAAAQDDLEDDFAAAMARATTTSATTVPSVSDAPTIAIPDMPGTSPPSNPPSAAPATTAPDPAPTTAPPLVLNEGDALGRMEIPAIGVDWIAVHGVRTEDIDRGPGHFPGTPLPGEPGNSAFAGHRTTHGAPFNRIDELVDGDRITVTTPQGRFEYEVFDQFIVDDSDVWVIETGDPDVAVLTLISCHPKRSTAQRIVVNAILIES